MKNVIEIGQALGDGEGPVMTVWDEVLSPVPTQTGYDWNRSVQVHDRRIPPDVAAKIIDEIDALIEPMSTDQAISLATFLVDCYPRVNIENMDGYLLGLSTTFAKFPWHVGREAVDAIRWSVSSEYHRLPDDADVHRECTAGIRLLHYKRRIACEHIDAARTRIKNNPTKYHDLTDDERAALDRRFTETMTTLARDVEPEDRPKRKRSTTGGLKNAADLITPEMRRLRVEVHGDPELKVEEPGDVDDPATQGETQC